MVKRLSLSAFTGLALALCSGTAIAASACLTAAETDAHQLRVLQTQLMVGALQCRGDSEAGQRANYNNFVRRYGPELLAGHRTLEAYFRRQFGAAYQRKLDAHITVIANEVSQESQNVADFCARIAVVGGALTAGPGLNLTEVSHGAPITEIGGPSAACIDGTDYATTTSVD
ncbi:MAG: hypothetical protein MI755_20930 [Sphingomonadales bacterium]|nr:hypothetical protein [Sphingomonadales bacterium]